MSTISSRQHHNKDLRSRDVKKMKLLTLDLGEGVPNLLERLDALAKIVQIKRPEFLALQNVSNDTIKRIKTTTWGTRYNAINPPYTYATRAKPTVALFSTYPAQDLATLPYHETSSNKVLQKGYFVMYDKQKQPYVISVCTTALESGLKVYETREKQLNESFLSLIEDEDAFVMGDFHIDNDIDGELELLGGWKDAWLSIPGNTSSNGYSYNPDKNPLIKEDPFGPGRPDRIYFKTRHFKLDSVELVGQDPFQLPGGKAVTVSTHYGVLAQFTPLDTVEPRVEPSIVGAVFKRPQWSLDFQQSKKK